MCLDIMENREKGFQKLRKIEINVFKKSLKLERSGFHKFRKLVRNGVIYSLS